MPFDTLEVWFSVGLLSGGLLLGGLHATIVSPSFRFWPHGTRNWTFWVSSTAWTLYLVGTGGVSYLDWWQWYEPPVLVQLGCVLVFTARTALSIWAMWTLIAGSIPALILADIGIVWFLLAPLAEDPWLREEYGGGYESYCEQVPRFIGWTTGSPGKTHTEERGGNSR